MFTIPKCIRIGVLLISALPTLSKIDDALAQLAQAGITQLHTSPGPERSSAAVVPQFVDISATAGIGEIPEHGGHAILFGDVNADGREDMYVTHTNFDPNDHSRFLVLPDELSLNNGDNTFTVNAPTVLRFTDITLSAGTGGPTASGKTGGHAAIFADVDDDTLPDLYITMYEVSEEPTSDLFYHNLGANPFAEEGQVRGIHDFDGGSHGACFADLDNDGDYDLYNGTTIGTTGISGVNNIYRNNGNGFFTDVTSQSGVPNREWQTRSVVAFDMEGDGDLDLFTVTDYLGTDDAPTDRDEIYRNEGNLHFTAIDTGALFTALAGQGATDTDFDGDGDIDIFAANRTGNVNILRNHGNGYFVPVPPEALGVTHRAPDGITTADLDNDGDLDLLLSGDNSGNMYLNNGAGTFTFKQGFSETDGYMGGFADLDNDGDLDLVFAGDDVSYLNDGNGNFATGPAIPVDGINDPRAVGFADIDNDGDVDFAFGCKRSRNWLVRNELDSGNWLKVKLISPQGQAGAFGAKARIYPAGQAGGTLLGLRESRSSQGYLGQDDPVLHFGLGPYTAVDLVVDFLDGTVFTKYGVQAGQTITVNGSAVDHTPPTISALAVEDSTVTIESAVVTWQTNEAADSQVEYGLTPALGSLVSNPIRVLAHRVELSGLLPDTTYYYQARSADLAGNASASATQTFRTKAIPRDTIGPVLSCMQATSISDSGALIQWCTNEPATSQVEFGVTNSLGSFTSIDVLLKQSHLVILSELQSETVYFYRAISQDSSGNISRSGTESFTTIPWDLTPPIISNVAASNVTAFSGTITWTTDEASTSQIEYGLTPDHSLSSPLDPALLTSHAVTLGGLTANTTYHYRVLSRDATGNLAVSDDFSFTTSNTSILFADDFNSGSLDASKWRRSTNPGNLSVVANNRLELRTSGRETGAVATQEAFLGRNTTITVKVVQPNDDGNLGMGPIYPFSAACYQFYIYREVASGPYRLYAQWKKNGVIDGLDITGNVVITGVVYMRLRLDDTHIHFEASLDGETWLDQYHEPFGLPGYTLDHSFYYELAAYNTPQKGVWIVDDFAISATSALPDTLPPQISQVAQSNITNSSATITWTTNEAGNSQVEYGLTTAYGSTSTLGESQVISHAVALSGLTANTTYHYRVLSRDAAGNLAVSEDFTFTTSNTSILFSDDFNSGSLDASKWRRSSNPGNLSVVANNRLELRTSGRETGAVATQEAFIGRNTTITAKVVQPNDDGNLGMGPIYPFSAACYQFYIYREVASGPYRLYAQWKKNGVIDGLDITGNMVITGVVYMRLRLDDTHIHFEASWDSQTWLDQYSEPFGLSGYTLDYSFYYELAAYNTPHKGVWIVDDFAIAATSSLPDTLPPQISQVTQSNVTNSSATITWTTDEASDSQVEYGLTTAYGSMSPLSTNQVTSHSMALSGLTANTTYHYRVMSRDAAGNLSVSGDFTFTTSNTSILFSDDFNSGSLDTDKWQRSTNPGNQSVVANNRLELRTSGREIGAVATQEAFPGRNTTVAVKVVQPNDDGNLAMGPLYPFSAGCYQFYVYREVASGPYRLYVQWNKNGVVDGFEITGSLVITGALYLRLRLDETHIHFEASLDGHTWLDQYSEPFGLTGYTLDNSFYYELAAYDTPRKGVLIVDDFAISSYLASSGMAKEMEERAPAPERFLLSQNHPNPFNLETQINLELPENGYLQAMIYNVNGQEVMSLHEGELNAGYHVLSWNGRSSFEQEASSGVYLLHLIFEGGSGKREVATRRMLLMK